ncbi:DUF3887 domain-containing protein [Leifsonia sp. ZF2019]|uniref:DUF3887 domain-containing protein n=1 Tax=Leifsonia sp. ZF2019 TaxID=2781978 RepID=UPI001CBD6977|nr:DUF3887 domain-containing protein [Leifsonia sp. ZF2019]UAJ79356.1 DUF3887 domain-containing protein [Leifsonia sp. ZF2019]
MTAERDAVAALAAAAKTLAEQAGNAADRGHWLELVAHAVALRADADAALAALVDAARAAGATWQDLGRTLGTSRQAAFQRFGHPVDPRTGEPMDTTPLAGADALATEIFGELAAGRYDAVVARFDERMAEGLDAAGLGAVWAQIASAVGAFDAADEPVARRMGDLTVVDVPLRFEAGEMVGRVSLHPDRRVGGLFVLDPAQLAESSGDIA